MSAVWGRHDASPRDLLAAVSANARNKIYFTCAPGDARHLEEHTLPELDRHDLAHLDTCTVAARLMAGGRQTPAFTMRTRPERPVVGQTEAIRRDAAATVAPQDTSGVDELVKRLAAPRDKQRDGRTRRAKGTKP